MDAITRDSARKIYINFIECTNDLLYEIIETKLVNIFFFNSIVFSLTP